MPDLRINASDYSLTLSRGGINTKGISKEQAEKLIAQISASLIKPDGTPRSGYLKVHAEAGGVLRFSTGHFSKGAKASAAALMHELAIKAWGESSVDTKALEKYLQSPDRREGQNIASNAQKAGTISLLKLVSNRYDAYYSHAEMKPLLEDRLGTSGNPLRDYANRFLKGEGARGGLAGRLSLGNASGRASDIAQILSDKNDAAAAAKKAEAIKNAGKANTLISGAVREQIEKSSRAFAASPAGKTASSDPAGIELQRQKAIQSLESQIFGVNKTVEDDLYRGLQVTNQETKEKINLRDRGTALGLTLGIEAREWVPNPLPAGTPIIRAYDTKSKETPVLMQGYDSKFQKSFSGIDLNNRRSYLANAENDCRQDVLAKSDRIENFAKAYRKNCREAEPHPDIPTTFGSTTAGIALGQILEFAVLRSTQSTRLWMPSLSTKNAMPRPLDYALIGVKGVDGLNFIAVNQVVAAMADVLKPDGDPHPAKLIQDAVNEVNRRLMGRESV